ncbi:MAG: TSUP family transporter [Chitinivibrionales bacterium]|nr:TSUP family transporter [Chitinivibrionales bacterium]
MFFGDMALKAMTYSTLLSKYRRRSLYGIHIIHTHIKIPAQRKFILFCYAGFTHISDYTAETQRKEYLMINIVLLGLLTLVASGVGTATGFGTSTIMIPVMVLFVPLPVALLFVGIIHLAGDIWKVLLFKRGFDWKLVLGFGLSGIIASYIGASLSMHAEDLPLKHILGAFLIMYVVFLFLKREWALPKTNGTAVSGGLLSGLFAGFFGVGGAVRGAFLMAFNLQKEVYIFTSGLIAMFIDVTRITRYFMGGTRLEQNLLIALIVSIPVSFAGAFLAKKSLDKLPQKFFRIFVGIFLALVGAKLLIWSP